MECVPTSWLACGPSRRNGGVMERTAERTDRRAGLRRVRVGAGRRGRLHGALQVRRHPPGTAPEPRARAQRPNRTSTLVDGETAAYPHHHASSVLRRLPPTGDQPTIEWLDRWDIPYWDICIMKWKDAVDASLYVDDSVGNVAHLRKTNKERSRSSTRRIGITQ
jgi:5' nucleotidase, deoxy (Pyrimidine), cytosolic type C protein (NT5C)